MRCARWPSAGAGARSRPRPNRKSSSGAATASSSAAAPWPTWPTGAAPDSSTATLPMPRSNGCSTRAWRSAIHWWPPTAAGWRRWRKANSMSSSRHWPRCLPRPIRHCWTGSRKRAATTSRSTRAREARWRRRRAAGAATPGRCCPARWAPIARSPNSASRRTVWVRGCVCMAGTTRSCCTAPGAARRNVRRWPANSPSSSARCATTTPVRRWNWRLRGPPGGAERQGVVSGPWLAAAATQRG